MSFIKKLTKGFDDLKANLSDKDKQQGHDQQGHSEQRDQSHGQPSYGHQAPPPGPPGSQLPPGWMQQWDQNSQRWYYLEQATGRTQWEPPMNYGAPPLGGGPGYAPPGVYGAQSGHPEQKKSGHGGMIAAGAGGLAVGAIGGAMLAHDSDEHVNQAGYGNQGGYGGDPYASAAGYGPPPPAGLPENDSNLSGSERSSIKSAREDLQEAQEEYKEGSQSSSDREELQEAQEEYHEEAEEAYDE